MLILQILQREKKMKFKMILIGLLSAALMPIIAQARNYPCNTNHPNECCKLIALKFLNGTAQPPGPYAIHMCCQWLGERDLVTCNENLLRYYLNNPRINSNNPSNEKNPIVHPSNHENEHEMHAN